MRVLQVKTKKSVSQLRFNSDSTALAACPVGGTPLVAFELGSGNPKKLPTGSGPRPICLAYSRDGNYLAIGSQDRAASVYRLLDNQRFAVLQASPGPGNDLIIRDVVFAPTADLASQWLAVCGQEFWLWNPVTQQYLVSPDDGVTYSHAAFAPLAEAVFVVSSSSLIRYRIRPFIEDWKVGFVDTLHFLASDNRRRYSWARSIPRVSPDGSVLIVNGDVSFACLDPETGLGKREVRVGSQIKDIAFLPNSRLLAVADGSPTLRVYDTDNGQLAREYDWGIGGIHCVTFSNDGAMGTAGGDKGKVVVWDLE